jgi:DNA-binding NarL/FixJ family response regulator
LVVVRPEPAVATFSEASGGGEILGAVGGPATVENRELTPREAEILKLLATGLANRQIAHRLRISDKTVRNHLSNLYDKLGIYDRLQAVLVAVRTGLVKL